MRAVQRAALLLTTVVMMANSAQASIITSLYGDKDGFGQGVPFVDGISYLANGGTLFTDARGPADLANAPLTDIWNTGFSTASWTHSYVLDGPVVSATLQFFIAGFADVGAVDLLVDGVVFGSYNFPPPNTTTHILSVGVPLVNIDGSTIFSFSGPSSDGWILDFAELTIETRSVVVRDVPAPASLILWGMGGGLAFLGKKLRRGRKTELAA